MTVLPCIVAYVLWMLLNRPATAQIPTPTTPISLSQVANATSTTAPPPWPTASVPTFPPEFSDIPKETLECWESWSNWELRRRVPNPGEISAPRITNWRSTYPTPIVSTWLTPVVGFTYTKVPIGLTTLCDGYPRASSASYINEYYTKWINTTYTFSTTFFHSTVPGITASGYEVHRPACTLAPNDNPMCDRVASAYQWWASSEAQASRTPSPEHPGALAKPSCWQLIRPDPQARPTCLFNHYSQEIYYWPTPTPTGTDFCNSSWVGPTAAPTIPGKPNTAVVSGYTLTSPSVYHFLHGVNISTYAGKKSRIDGSYVPRTNVFLPAITPSPLRPYVYSELESDMLTAWGTRKRKETYSKYTVAKDFRLLDVHTIRADKWYGNSSSRRNSTIFQNEANPLLAIPLSEFMEQNDLGHGLTDCKWVSGTRVQSSATYIIDSVSLSSFYEITASEVVVPITTEPAPGPTASSSPLVTTVR